MRRFSDHPEDLLQHAVEIRWIRGGPIRHRHRRTCGRNDHLNDQGNQNERQEGHNHQTKNLKPHSRHHFAAQFHRTPEFQTLIGNKRHTEYPGKKKVNSWYEACATKAQTRQKLTDESCQDELAERNLETRKHVGHDGGLAADTFEKYQVESASKNTVQEGVYQSTENIELKNELDRPVHKAHAEQQTEVTSKKLQ